VVGYLLQIYCSVLWWRITIWWGYRQQHNSSDWFFVPPYVARGGKSDKTCLWLRWRSRRLYNRLLGCVVAGTDWNHLTLPHFLRHFTSTKQLENITTRIDMQTHAGSSSTQT